MALQNKWIFIFLSMYMNMTPEISVLDSASDTLNTVIHLYHLTSKHHVNKVNVQHSIQNSFPRKKYVSRVCLEYIIQRSSYLCIWAKSISCSKFMCSKEWTHILRSTFSHSFYDLLSTIFMSSLRETWNIVHMI